MKIKNYCLHRKFVDLKPEKVLNYPTPTKEIKLSFDAGIAFPKHHGHDFKK